MLVWIIKASCHTSLPAVHVNEAKLRPHCRAQESGLRVELIPNEQERSKNGDTINISKELLCTAKNVINEKRNYEA